MQKHNDAMKTSGHRSLEKYTSHFIWKGSKGLLKVLLCEKWVEDWTELQHIDPHSYGHKSVSFPFSWAAQPGAWGPSLSGTWSSFQHLLSNSLGLWTPTAQSGVLRAPSARCWFSLQHLISNQLELPVHRVILLFNVHSIKPVDRQGYPLDTFDRMHLLFIQVHFLFWQLGRGQYATIKSISVSSLSVIPALAATTNKQKKKDYKRMGDLKNVIISNNIHHQNHHLILHIYPSV